MTTSQKVLINRVIQSRISYELIIEDQNMNYRVHVAGGIMKNVMNFLDVMTLSTKESTSIKSFIRI